MGSYLGQSSLPMTGIIALVAFLLFRAWLVTMIEQDHLIELENQKLAGNKAAAERWAPLLRQQESLPQLAGMPGGDL